MASSCLTPTDPSCTAGSTQVSSSPDREQAHPHSAWGAVPLTVLHMDCTCIWIILVL